MPQSVPSSMKWCPRRRQLIIITFSLVTSSSHGQLLFTLISSFHFISFPIFTISRHLSRSSPNITKFFGSCSFLSFLVDSTTVFMRSKYSIASGPYCAIFHRPPKFPFAPFSIWCYRTLLKLKVFRNLTVLYYPLLTFILVSQQWAFNQCYKSVLVYFSG